MKTRISRKPSTCADDLEAHSKMVQRIQEDHEHPDHAYYALIHPYQREKKRSCLRCGKVFRSRGAGNRVCAVCKNATVGASAEKYG